MSAQISTLNNRVLIRLVCLIWMVSRRFWVFRPRAFKFPSKGSDRDLKKKTIQSTINRFRFVRFGSQIKRSSCIHNVIAIILYCPHEYGLLCATTTYLNVVLGKRIAAVSLVDYLSHSDHVVVVVADRHAQYQIGGVTGHVVDFPVKPWVLENV